MPLDWWHLHRVYIMVAAFPLLGVSSGIDLASKHAVWQRAVGIGVLLATLVGVGIIVRWILRPVDIGALRRRREMDERFSWRNMLK